MTRDPADTTTEPGPADAAEAARDTAARPDRGPAAASEGTDDSATGEAAGGDAEAVLRRHPGTA
ncbi:ABC transporter ATP-binding protein, partial [Streptomyces sp. SID89]|nr:ABC transporter ATP-binding protein [Streptomyces sp. SID89]